jgi:hypothetical protein
LQPVSATDNDHRRPWLSLAPVKALAVVWNVLVEFGLSTRPDEEGQGGERHDAEPQ